MPWPQSQAVDTQEAPCLSEDRPAKPTSCPLPRLRCSRQVIRDVSRTVSRFSPWFSLGGSISRAFLLIFQTDARTLIIMSKNWFPIHQYHGFHGKFMSLFLAPPRAWNRGGYQIHHIDLQSHLPSCVRGPSGPAGVTGTSNRQQNSICAGQSATSRPRLTTKKSL